MYTACLFLKLGLGLGCQGAGLLEEELSLFAQELAAFFFFFFLCTAPWAKLNFGDSVYHCQKRDSFQIFACFQDVGGVPDEQACKK